MGDTAKMIKGDLCDLFNTRPRSLLSKIGMAASAFNLAVGVFTFQPVVILGSLGTLLLCTAGDRMNRENRPPSP